MRSLGDVGEFGFIERIRRQVGGRRSAHVRVGLGDDAAVLRAPRGEDLVVTTDSLVEDVHFRWQSQSPLLVGRRALLVNLSDLAAMGARPLGCVLALSAPAALGLDRADALVRGLLREADEHACPLVGGNLARARETSLTLTVFGAVASGRALRRNAARVGDRLFVTGTLGRSALELARARHFGGRIRTAPEGRLAAGRALARLPWRGACIDLSDGLGADLPHLLEAGGLGAEVEAARLPRPRGFDRACARLGLDPLRLLVGGGEDYELLFTLRPRAPAPAVLSRRLGVPVSEIGRIVRRPGIHGLPGALVRQGGWRHF